MIDAVGELRAFNRFYTRTIGVLGPGLFGTAHPLPDARVLYELAEEREVGVLRAALDMDAGFLSRVLARLERRGLVARTRSPEDGRRQLVRLTASGTEARADLEARTARAAADLLEAVPGPGRDDLLAALRSVRAALEPGAGGVHLRALGPGDRGWIVARHGALYAREHGWDERFEQLVAQVVGEFAPGPRARAWIAEIEGVPAGCVLCVPEDERTARLRLLLVEPHARGAGVGGALIDACLAFARDTGCARLVLWTNDVLTNARRLYDRRGFTLIDEAPHARFGPPMTGQNLALDLGDR